MPAISAPAKILVTGASGFLGTHVVKAFIDRGYQVRGTVRTSNKGVYLKSLFGDRFEYDVVPDMSEPNAFDKAVIDMNAIIHTASPVAFYTGDPNAIIKQAVEGTLNVLESAKAFGPEVRRVVVTSSINTIGDQSTTEVVLDETMWWNATVQRVHEKGAAATPTDKYSASKLLAEKGAWEFMEKNKGALKFDLVTVHPTWLMGPLLHEGTDIKSINISSAFLMAGIDGAPFMSVEDLTKKVSDMIDIRDAAKAHLEVLEREGSSMQRVIADARSWCWQDVLNALGEATPGATKQWPAASSDKLLNLVGKSREEFYIPFEDTIEAAVETCRARGWSGIADWNQAKPSVV